MNYSSIQSSLLGLVGFRQTGTTVTLSTLHTSSSGIWIQDEDPLLTLENLEALVPDDIDFEEWLANKLKASINKTVRDWETMKVLKGSGKNLLTEHLMIKNTPQNYQSTWSNIGAIELTTRSSKGLRYSVKLSLHLTDSATVELKVFEAGKSAPVATQSLNYTTGDTVQWFDVDYEFTGEKVYYLAYDMSSVTAYNLMKGWTYDYFPSGRFYTARAVRHSEGIASLWDLNENEYVYDDNFGINLRVSVTCDYTDLIIDQKNIFANAIAKRLGIDLLEELASNAQAVVQKNIRNVDPAEIRIKIYGHGVKTVNPATDYSLMKQYKDALKAIQFDTTNIDNYCLTCKKGIRHGTI